MKIIEGWRSDPQRPLTDPLPEKKWSFVLRFYGGDWLDPIGIGTNWFTPPFPKHILHIWWPLWLSYALFILTTGILLAAVACAPWWAIPPAFVIWLLTPGKFIAWRFDRRSGYAGSKVYGVDSTVYPLWLCKPEEVYPGSLAMCLTIRPFANANKR
jgi:hypothetical protein